MARRGSRPTPAPFLFPTENEDVRPALARGVHSHCQGLEIGRDLDMPDLRDLAFDLVSGFQSTFVHPESGGRTAGGHARPPIRIIFPVEFQVSNLLFSGSNKRKAVTLVGLDLKLVSRIHRLAHAVPRGRET